MTKDSAQPYVFFLARGKVFIFHPKQKGVFEIPIPDPVIKDLEIKKSGELDKLLANYIQENKILPGQIYLILSSDVVLEKVFPNSAKEALKNEAVENVNLAPFNHVGFQMVQTGKDVTLILVNRELYEGFQDILERLGFHVSAVTPAKAIGLPGGQFTAQTGREVLNRAAAVFQSSFIADPEQTSRSENSLSSDPRRNKKLLTLLLALGLLIVVLGGLVIKMTVFPDKAAPTNGQQAPKNSTSAETPIPASTITPEANATPSAGLETVRIQVLNASGKTGLAESVKTKLITAGFKLVEVGNAPTLNSDRLQIVFAPGLATNIRLTVVEALAGTFPNPVTRERSASGDFDVVISLTNSE